jgi:aminoglycoside phosphotransferase (APT) family kinase protein
MVHVTAVRRRSNPHSTLLPTEVLELDLSSGDAVSIFVKRLDETRPDHPDKERRDRELMLYENLLANADLPVARCLGVRREHDGRARELYLEHLDGLDLRYQGLEHWYVAAGRLADLHRHFAERADLHRARRFLLQLDHRYFEAWAERALAEVAQTYPDAAAKLTHVIEDLEPATAPLAAQPITLVHNDLSPKNAVVVTSVEPERLAFVDWELAGAGCGALDLVHLAFGLDPEARRRLFDSYWLALEGSRLAIADRGERATLLAACELHKTLYRLAHVRAFGSDEATVSRWLDDAASCRSRL